MEQTGMLQFVGVKNQEFYMIPNLTIWAFLVWAQDDIANDRSVLTRVNCAAADKAETDARTGGLVRRL